MCNTINMNELLSFFRTHGVYTEITENRVSLQEYEEDELKLKIFISDSDGCIVLEIQDIKNALNNYFSNLQHSGLLKYFTKTSSNVYKFKKLVVANAEIEATFAEIGEIVRMFIETARSVLNNLNNCDLASVFPKNNSAFVLDNDLYFTYFSENPPYFEDLIVLVSYDDSFYYITLMKKEVMYKRNFNNPEVFQRINRNFDIKSDFKENLRGLVNEFFSINFSSISATSSNSSRY